MRRGHPKGRRPSGCRHCDMVDDYRLTREAQEAYRDWRNENADSSITFKEWLRKFQWEGE